MANSSPAIVRVYSNEIEAEIARAALESAGILAFVQASNAAGLFISTHGVQLVVRAGDLEEARAVLDAVPEDFPPDGEQDDDEDDDEAS